MLITYTCYSIYIPSHKYLFIYLSMCPEECMYMYKLYVCMYACMYVCMYVYLSLSLYIYIYIYTHTYTYTHIIHTRAPAADKNNNDKQ